MTNGSIHIRRATLADAEGVSRVVTRSLRVTNAKDYAPKIVDRLVANFSPERVAAQITKRQAYVALHDSVVVGTASLSDGMVKTVFVDPDYQGKGIGTRLMGTIERAARDLTVTTLSVPSSITAEGFYAKLGFVPLREEYHEDERTIIMTKDIAIPAKDP